MSMTLTPPVIGNAFATAPNTPRRMPLSREQYSLLGNAGMLPERCELIDGEIIEKLSQSPDHTQSMRRVERVMRRLFGEEFVYSQTPLVLGAHDEPEPDVFVTTLPEATFLQRQPTASDSCLSIEVSVSTLDFDTGRKASRYALAGVADYWVVDVESRRLLVFRDPAGGAYPAPLEFDETQIVSSLAAPLAAISVVDLLP